MDTAARDHHDDCSCPDCLLISSLYEEVFTLQDENRQLRARLGMFSLTVARTLAEMSADG